MKASQLQQRTYQSLPLIVALVLLCLLPPVFCAADDHAPATIEISSTKKPDKKTRLDNGQSFYSFSVGGKTISEGKAGGKEVPIIIELDTPPAAAYASGGFASFARQTARRSSAR